MQPTQKVLESDDDAPVRPSIEHCGARSLAAQEEPTIGAGCWVQKLYCMVWYRSVHEFVEPYSFPSFHERILEPYDYYEFGQRYVSDKLLFPKATCLRDGAV